MFVVDVSIALLLCWPANMVVFALFIKALPGPRMSLLMLREVTTTLELFRTFSATIRIVDGSIVLLSMGRSKGHRNGNGVGPFPQVGWALFDERLRASRHGKRGLVKPNNVPLFCFRAELFVVALRVAK